MQFIYADGWILNRNNDSIGNRLKKDFVLPVLATIRLEKCIIFCSFINKSGRSDLFCSIEFNKFISVVNPISLDPWFYVWKFAKCYCPYKLRSHLEPRIPQKRLANYGRLRPCKFRSHFERKISTKRLANSVYLQLYKCNTHLRSGIAMERLPNAGRLWTFSSVKSIFLSLVFFSQPALQLLKKVTLLLFY